jgi:hypothetical protein
MKMAKLLACTVTLASTLQIPRQLDVVEVGDRVEVDGTAVSTGYPGNQKPTELFVVAFVATIPLIQMV